MRFILLLSLLISSKAFSWSILADFESGVVGDKAQNTVDAFHSDAGASRYVSDPVFKGEQAASVSIKSGKTGFGSWGGIFYFPEDLSEGDELWYQVNILFPDGWDFDCGGCTEGVKFMRIHTESRAGNNEGYHTILIKGGAQGGKLSVNTEIDSPDFKYNRGLGQDVTRDSWHTYEMYIKFSSGNGIYRVWKDGVLLDEQFINTLNTFTSKSNAAYLFTYWNNGSPKDQTAFVDEIKITNERPRNRDSNGNFFIGTKSPKSPILYVQ